MSNDGTNKNKVQKGKESEYVLGQFLSETFKYIDDNRSKIANGEAGFDQLQTAMKYRNQLRKVFE